MTQEIQKLQDAIWKSEIALEKLSNYCSYEFYRNAFGNYYVTLLVKPKHINKKYYLRLDVLFDVSELVSTSPLIIVNKNIEADNDLYTTKKTSLTELKKLSFSLVKNIATLMWLEDLNQSQR